jgi:hypothetical protein
MNCAFPKARIGMKTKGKKIKPTVAFVFAKTLKNKLLVQITHMKPTPGIIISKKHHQGLPSSFRKA